MKPTWLCRRNKFNARPSHDLATGHTYDSKGERRRWELLRLLERAGEITDLVFKPEPVVLDAKAGIKWRVDYSYIEAGRRVWEDWKPRPMTARENMLLKMWKAHGPGLLRITGGRGGKTTVLRSVMPDIQTEAQQTTGLT